MANYTVLPGYDAREHLEFESKVLASEAGGPTSVLFYINAPCIIVGRYNKLEEWVNVGAAANDSVPILRRQSGGGAVYHDSQTLCYSLIASVKLLNDNRRILSHLDFFRTMLIAGLQRAGIGAERNRLSDLVMNGRKISGNAARITKNRALLHGTLLFSVNYEAMETYLPIPPDRPGVSHREFVTSLRDEGVCVGRKTIMDSISSAVNELLP